MNVVAYVQESWDLIQVLQDLLPKVSSSAIKEKVEAMLAKAVVKRIITAAASAVIPGIGWAIAIINLGLAAYDLYQLNSELRELVELARIDVAGCIYDPETNSMKVAERYGGMNNRASILLTSISDSNPSNKSSEEFYLAYVYSEEHMVYVSNYTIDIQYAMAIMNIPNEDKLGDDGMGLSVYTPDRGKALDMVSDASKGTPIEHTNLGSLDIGLRHFHHPLHDGNGNYPAHAFYGSPMTG